MKEKILNHFIFLYKILFYIVMFLMVLVMFQIIGGYFHYTKIYSIGTNYPEVFESFLVYIFIFYYPLLFSKIKYNCILSKQTREIYTANLIENSENINIEKKEIRKDPFNKKYRDKDIDFKYIDYKGDFTPNEFINYRKMIFIGLIGVIICFFSPGIAIMLFIFFMPAMEELT
jgi:hypothetical protein